MSGKTETYCDECDDPRSKHTWPTGDGLGCDVEDCTCEAFVEAEPPLVRCRG